MKKITLRKKIIITSIISPAIVLGIIFYIVMPTINDIIEMRNNINSQRMDLEKKYQKGQSLKQLNENINIIEPQLEKLNSLFIKPDEVLEFITTLENAANKNNIDQKINLDLSMGVDENDYKKTPVQIAAGGSFRDQLKYLSALESLNYYVNIKSFTITTASPKVQAESQANEDMVNFNFFADTYWK